MTDYRGRGNLGDLADADEGILFVFHGGTIAEMTDEFNDVYNGLGGNDSIYAGQTNDTVIGGSGDDILDGGSGADLVYGGAGNDTLTTSGISPTVDQLFGGSGDDMMTGGDGHETFEGGRGVDSIFGGTGVDVIRILDGDEIDYVDAGGTLAEGVDTLELSFIKSVGIFIDLEAQTYHLVGGPSQTILNVEQISGTQKSDTMIGTGAQETFVGHNGGDSLVGGGGIDFLYGFKGGDTLLGEAGLDQLFGGTGVDLLYGGTNNDYLDGGAAADRLYGGTGDDTMVGDDGDNSLYAGAGNDAVLGIKGDDYLFASEGNDGLDGGQGNDTLVSGTGSDHFVFSEELGRNNVDTLVDFERGADQLVLFDRTGLGFSCLGTSVEESEIVIGTHAQDADDHLVYDPETGTLYLDFDGQGGVGKVAFAILQNLPAELSAADFLIPT